MVIMICRCGADEKQLGLAENRRKAENEAEMEGKAGDGAEDGLQRDQRRGWDWKRTKSSQRSQEGEEV